MRIWSLHPKYLDTKGLVALWRETLLAKHVLEGNTKGYKNHPQLNRFKETINPSACINQYWISVYHEAVERGYNFSKEKINWEINVVKLKVTKGQLGYEFEHLLHKLKSRDENRFKEIVKIELPDPHPLFSVVDGDVEAWEIIKEQSPHISRNKSH
ncbi:pyrimidine dimer DNA glycosylase/endonuclease V [Flavobacteriaceae bacterium 3-367]|uniref:pyrimidine dimer DNA glycosylase/endonuclease V n=1 Tax=Eudoraea algarum TaxID=3417568 RepID=UPI00328E13C7